jgi:hypothetical protein
MHWQTPSEHFEACQRGTPCHVNACGATACFCRVTRTGMTNNVRSVNICPVDYFKIKLKNKLQMKKYSELDRT